MRVAVVTGVLGMMVAAASFAGAPATVAEATERKPAKTACQRLKANNPRQIARPPASRAGATKSLDRTHATNGA